MILLSLLLVLGLERIISKSPLWCFEHYFSLYVGWLKKRGWLMDDSPTWMLALQILTPVVVLQLLLNLLDSSFIQFAINTLVLAICVGCPQLRVAYKQYLQAANRGDTQACVHYADELGHEPERDMSVGQTLMWINYRYYGAVMLWFAVFGPAGALLYVLSRNMLIYMEGESPEHVGLAHDLVKILDWVPVRITTLGFVFMGHYSKAFPMWLSYLANTKDSALKVLSDISKAAEECPNNELDLTQEPCALVSLAKRNITFITVVIAVFTLMGWVD
ncbi:beta-lactamase regulator AmpE [Alteromonadaceae bacterium BrNp21-10]|nr:beta-lactamase regulator AmpE [Alteromonadaceae bacterium BrNp21-10]